MAPAKTPEGVVKKLQEETYKALRSPAVVERFASEDAVIGGGPSAEFAALITQQQGVWKEVVAKAHIKVD